MLRTWGGDGLDVIQENELHRVGRDTCEEYCKIYCYDRGCGKCANCALTARRENVKVEEK